MKVGESVVGVMPPSPVTILTYDDGPTPGVTDRLLAVLSEHDATATFFILIPRLRRFPGLVDEILAGGHEIGLHGTDHRRQTSLRRAELREEAVRGRRELEDATGRQVRWFRPPYGAQSPASWRAAVSAGLTPVMWSVQVDDWLTLPAGEHLAHVRDRPLGGEMLLLHDGFAEAEDGADDGPPPELDRVELTRGVLAEIRDQGLVGRSLGEAVAAGTARREVRLAPGTRLRARVRATVRRTR